MRRALDHLLFLAFCMLALSSNVSAQASDTPNREETADAPDSAKSAGGPLYIIQPNDVLEIYVWKEPELTRKVLVRPDGRISFPLVQDMQAAGMSPADIKLEVERELKKYIEVPNVTVIVDAIQSYRVFVTGKVGKPGVIAVEKPITVLQALALAGGFLDFANPAEMVVIRNTGSGNVLFRFNYPEVIKGKNFNQNMLLRSGDVIVVP
ncbi:MAG: sugar transporter [Acidobacteria bacterium]|nr:MAG: sugar transporter [Acidobacteriota bacterium]PYS50776.1 MAG: sugar transporter [Acidobacteriota bacterium]